MKAVIEIEEGLYLIKIYGNDRRLCDTFVVDNIHYSEEGRRMDELLNSLFEEVRG